MADINDDDAKKTVRDRIVEHMDYFRDQHDIDAESGITGRIADRFALAYAAGCFAADYEVLPFNRRNIFSRISECFKAALTAQPETWTDRFTRIDTTILEYLKSGKFPALDSKDSWSKKEIEKIEGFQHTIKEINVVTIKRQVITNQKLIPEGFITEVCNSYRSEGYLLPDAGGNNTRSITLNDEKVRYYCFVWPRDNSNIAAAKKLIKGYSMKMKQNNKE